MSPEQIIFRLFLLLSVLAGAQHDYKEELNEFTTEVGSIAKVALVALLETDEERLPAAGIRCNGLFGAAALAPAKHCQFKVWVA